MSKPRHSRAVVMAEFVFSDATTSLSVGDRVSMVTIELGLRVTSKSSFQWLR
jgi:hypothetical protein